jgi:hypothetical protein
MVSVVPIVSIVLMEYEDVGTPQDDEEKHHACAEAQCCTIYVRNMEDEKRS